MIQCRCARGSAEIYSRSFGESKLNSQHSFLSRVAIFSLSSILFVGVAHAEDMTLQYGWRITQVTHDADNQKKYISYVDCKMAYPYIAWVKESTNPFFAELFACNIETGTIQQIPARNLLGASILGISSKQVVCGLMDQTSRSRSLVLYDLSNNTTRTIADKLTLDDAWGMGGGIVIWHDHTKKVFRLYDLATGKTSQMAVKGPPKRDVVTDGKTIAWSQIDGKQLFIYACNMASGTASKIDMAYYPYIAGDNIAWLGSSTHDRLFYRDLKTGKTTDMGDAFEVWTARDSIFWIPLEKTLDAQNREHIQGKDAQLLNLSTGKITIIPGTAKNATCLSDGKLFVWSKDESGKTATFIFDGQKTTMLNLGFQPLAIMDGTMALKGVTNKPEPGSNPNAIQLYIAHFEGEPAPATQPSTK